MQHLVKRLTKKTCVHRLSSIIGVKTHDKSTSLKSEQEICAQDNVRKCLHTHTQTEEPENSDEHILIIWSIFDQEKNGVSTSALADI